MKMILISAVISSIISLVIINHEAIWCFIEDIPYNVQEWLAKKKKDKGGNDRT